MGAIKSKKTIVNDIKFDSSSEAAFYKKLIKMKEEGIIKDFKMQISFQILDPFTHGVEERQGRRYICDFIITTMQDEEIVVDIKTPASDTYAFKLKEDMFLKKFKDSNFWIIYAYQRKLNRVSYFEFKLERKHGLAENNLFKQEKYKKRKSKKKEIDE
ncbi:DUF1064 domain-containing protein [Lysinibacillus sp. NPDC098008]|uniref:DUF1064 domain-containing protein n=1 Tax=Lysinibacillus sp. NPDC098008 TaxID=3364146 RepID=UPI0037F63557